MEKIRSFLTKHKKLMFSLTLALSLSLSCIGCFATEDTSVSSAVTGAMGVFTTVVSTLTSNPILLVILGASLIPLGFKIFKSAKRSVK